MTLQIRQVTNEDWEQVRWIYEAGIATKLATFETQAPSFYEQWINNAVLNCTLVAVEDNQIKGWCKLNRVSTRKVYAGVGEVSVYVHPQAMGQGIGQMLLQKMIQKSEEEGFWTLESKIFVENHASIQLHKKNGFREVGIRKKIAKLDGEWKDTLLLERRSERIK